MNNYEKIMKKCISLAKKGIGRVSPNPLVGCVVLNKKGEIIAQGYHHKYGKNHAERDALLKLKNGEERGGTLIVNLEPCSHFGKTPPCADLIIERGLSTVVIGTVDNNPKVSGEGIKRLKEAGISVIQGVLEKECRELNEIFFTNIEEKRTFVALKIATTLDGKIATKTGDSKWITSCDARDYAKKLRQHYDAILTSSSTVQIDNPTMKHNKKIVIDRTLKTDFNSNIYKQGNVILVVDEKANINKISLPQNITVLKVRTDKNKQIDLKILLKTLYELGIKSVFVEAGGELAGSFIRENLVDKIYQFISPKILNDNSGKTCFNGDCILKINDCKRFIIKSIKKFSTDIMISLKSEN